MVQYNLHISKVVLRKSQTWVIKYQQKPGVTHQLV